ncbi:hypothetical protein I5M27_15815 [Adhaeribacter sp. BT258]|uniref:Uncharacterized protein n=1 Tax=Adhaeribacter terrigena TaxID=2793070 RepID=A0ABS1C5H9_9BACT|nr:hypothetical protein [Adhaeribacter terrigena]MBK0404466.1 hypothetical protein [Adhaeribacter terrigena]
MANFVQITYDLTSKHIEVKNGLKAKGYFDYIIDDQGKVVSLPNTTVVKPDTTKEVAFIEFSAVVNEVNFTLPINEKTGANPFIVEFSNDEWKAKPTSIHGLSTLIAQMAIKKPLN